MTPLLENNKLGNDLDCRTLNLLNPGKFFPVPAGLVDIDDPRLNDPRVPTAASILDVDVAATAAIDQSKLLLNDVIPPTWLGTGDDQAAPGNLVEHVAQKGVPGGYAPLTSGGLLPASSIAAGASPGTVNFIAMSMPKEFEVQSLVISGTGVQTLLVGWINQADKSWFGTFGSPLPSFLTGQIPSGLVPSLPASRFTTGIFDVDLLPVAAGMGTGHAPGILPDPGDTGHAEDYLGRDMKWRQFNADQAYQPVAPQPNIIFNAPTSILTVGTVTIRNRLPGAALFYRVTPDTGYTEASGDAATVPLPDGQTAYAYCARQGYNNSIIATFTAPSGVST